MKKIRLTMAQALVRYLAAQRIETPSGLAPLFHGVCAIFGHGNVAGLGPALPRARTELPAFRAHNEQAMAHAAIAFAKAALAGRMMACTTSIGPGATNLVTAAALAHVNRLPVLFLPGDIFASRRPDPVLQQLEAFGDPTVSVNDCLRPVSRYLRSHHAARADPRLAAAGDARAARSRRSAGRPRSRCRRTCRRRLTTTRSPSSPPRAPHRAAVAGPRRLQRPWAGYKTQDARSSSPAAA